MEQASRILSILLGLAVVALLLWPINIPLGFGQAWWAKEMAAKREGSNAATPPTASPAVAAGSQAAGPAPAAAPPAQQVTSTPQTHAVADPAPSPEPVPAAEKDESARVAALQKDASPTPKPRTKLYYKVQVIDAGTIGSGGIVITLDGITARDAKASCKDAKGRPWSCGSAGRIALTRLIRTRAVSCTLPAGGEQKTFTARCSVAGTDLSTWVVRQGWANPKDGSEKALADAEGAAKKDKVGIWRGTQ
ncbi:hypothetical protein [Methyloceanibacter sp.]|uniref:thermonuclease family protein n=1 Tax=Methyloceanibacter sp. TaxID=1965321 RepID=UPI002D5DD43E|nr:hypothetical protein [Methyloceanibacter sp.]HZP09407.1 hypothetical protein [Methyloceanibacter sp.]